MQISKSPIISGYESNPLKYAHPSPFYHFLHQGQMYVKRIVSWIWMIKVMYWRQKNQFLLKVSRNKSRKSCFIFFIAIYFVLIFVFFYIFKKEKTEIAGPPLLIVSFFIMTIITKTIGSFSSTWWLGESVRTCTTTHSLYTQLVAWW